MSLLKALNLPVLASHRGHKHVPNGGSSRASPARAPTTPSNTRISAAGKVTPSGGTGLATVVVANAAAEKRYDLVVGRNQLKSATLVETVRALAGELQRLKGTFDAERQAHGERMGRGAESLSAAAVALISEKLGGAEMPSLDIWDPAFAALDDARRAIRTLAIEQAAQALQTAGDAYRNAHTVVAKYDGALETGGDRAVTTLRVTAAAGAVAAGVATGGIATAAGAGVVGTAGVGAATAGAYGATQELAGQGSEVYLANTRKQIDWKAVLRRGASDAATGLVGGLVGGALTKQFSKMFGSYLGKAITDAELAELGKALGLAGPLERTFFMTTGQKLIAEFLSGAALVPVQSAITLAINRISGGAQGPRDMEEFMSGVAHDVIQGGIFQLLVTFLTHKMPAKAAGASKPRGGAPASKPAGGADATVSPGVKPSPGQGQPRPAEPVASQPTSHPHGQASAGSAVEPSAGRGPSPQAVSKELVAGKPANKNVEVTLAGGTPKRAHAPMEDAAAGQHEAAAPTKRPLPSEPTPPVEASPTKSPVSKKTRGKRTQEELREKRRIDVEHGDAVDPADQHAAKTRSRKQQREKQREGARHHPDTAAEAAGEEAMALYEKVRAQRPTSMHDANKRKLVQKFEALMKQAGWPEQKRNPLKGNFDEALRTPKAADAQPEYLAGGKRLPGQGKRGTARPDYDRRQRGKKGDGGARAVQHVNIKADSLQIKNKAQALAVARKYLKDAQKNAKALPTGGTVLLRYGTRPVDDLGGSTSIEEAMNAIHFAPGSPISEVHYGTVAYRNPNAVTKPSGAPKPSQ